MKAAVLALVVAMLGPPAWAASLSTDLSDHEIAITSNFNGTSLLLFGSKGTESAPNDLDIIVVVHGPETPMRIWRKTRVAGIWINAEPVKFDNVPGYYAVVSNRPLADIAGADYLRRENIGPRNLVLYSTDDATIDELQGLRDALVTNRRSAGLYIEADEAIRFPAGSLFRTNIYFPANVPVGDYRVIVRLFREGREIDRTTTVLTVGKRGLEQQIYTTAHDHPFLYGIAAVLVAIAAGWAASMAFRQR